jgi:hypothetical protein
MTPHSFAKGILAHLSEFVKPLMELILSFQKLIFNSVLADFPWPFSMFARCRIAERKTHYTTRIELCQYLFS